MSGADKDDDIWAGSDDDSISYDRDIAAREWERLNENHGNEGYKEGITEGKEVLMQKGFDRGYTEGLELGKAFGRLRGTVSTHLTFYRDIVRDEAIASKLENLYNELCKVDVQHVFTTDYFKPGSDCKNDPKATLSAWEARVKKALEG
ncbi:hypothetical protein BX666DRAFT_2033505 [Dichotomocladium elegans]|nr:hypothetical protein BX666DRAFT_2033505 [Dichotomocladium elegans]